MPDFEILGNTEKLKFANFWEARFSFRSKVVDEMLQLCKQFGNCYSFSLRVNACRISWNWTPSHVIFTAYDSKCLEVNLFEFYWDIQSKNWHEIMENKLLELNQFALQFTGTSHFRYQGRFYSLFNILIERLGLPSENLESILTRICIFEAFIFASCVSFSCLFWISYKCRKWHLTLLYAT